MAIPLRKDIDEQKELTTADPAQGGTGTEPAGPTSKPVASDWASSILDREPDPSATPLFPNNELENLCTRWTEIQTAFVDQPRTAVEQADGLVASAMKRLGEVFADERSQLEKQWDRGDNVSTEELRIAFQRYRAFFDRLLSV
jgi:hypothetical protein